MKRSIFGFVLMIVLLISGIAAALWMDSHHRPITADLSSAAQCALDGDWENARFHLSRAEEAWRKDWNLDAALTDHQPMEEIDSLFCRMAVYGALEDTGKFSAECRELAERINDLSDVHGLEWWSFL